MDNNLYILTNASQCGNTNSLLEIIEKFEPLIKKYSRKLNYDGADTDLIINLIETIRSIPIHERTSLKKEECLVSYIANSLKYKYIRLSKKYSSLYGRDLELKEELLGEEISFDIETHIMLDTFLDKLPLAQKTILNEIYIKGYTVSEVAEKSHISRQAVNKTKNRALENLKKHLQESHFLT
jgi:RNA polymerase sigma factor (sigma-70 family)